MIELFKHNFDEEQRRPVDTHETETADSIDELKSRLAEARQQGFDAGRACGKQDAIAEFEKSDAARLAQIREKIWVQLEQLTKQDALHRKNAEKDVIDLFCALAERLVPELIDRYGIALAVERIRKSLNNARTDPILTIKTSPEVMDVLETEAQDWLSKISWETELEMIADPQMNQSAAQVYWKGGRLEYDLHAACYSVLSALQEAAAADSQIYEGTVK